MAENQDTQQVNEEPKEQPVDISNSEIISNGKPVEVKDNPNEEQQDTQKEGDKEDKKDIEPATEQADYQKAKTEITDAKTELESKGIDFAKLEAEYDENGSLSKESYKLLEDKGYPKALVEAAITGWQAKADAFGNKVIADAGGINEFKRIQKFVSSQGNDAVKAFNVIMQKDDLSVVSSYIAGVKAQMAAKYGSSNPTLGGAGATGNATGYADAAAMVAAMSDPRYGKDPKYMQEVERKVAASTFFG